MSGYRQSAVTNAKKSIRPLTSERWRKNFSTTKLFFHCNSVALALTLATIGLTVKPVEAEGSRNLYPAGAPGSRANLIWQPGEFFFGSPTIRIRTLLKVYARAGENILLGSSAVGVNGLGDAVVYNPGLVTGPIGDESIPGNPSFSCNTQRTTNPAQGQITSRSQELAGPQAIAGGGNPTGYVPCFYTAPTDGIYDVVFYGSNGSAGGAPGSRGNPTGDVNLSNSVNFDATQGSSVAAWDVTVRSSDPTSTTDINGRLFTFYTTLFAGGNSRFIYSSLYPITADGYKYQTNFNGLDPNLFISAASRAGFLDPDGKTPLYHDVASANSPNDDLLNSIQGGIIPVRPEFPIFFSNTVLNPEVNNTLAAITLPNSGAASLPPLPSSIPSSPIQPAVSNFSFTGTAGGNNSLFSTGGSFSYQANVANTYQIVISRDGTNFDPTNPNNRVLRGLNLSGSQTVAWDGKDNSGTPFPIGTNYQTKIQIQAGDYHFLLLDIENSLASPSIQLLNPPSGVCPPLTGGCRAGFYDDRGYRVSTGATVGTVGSVLNGSVPPTISNSDPINGFDTGNSQRAFGDNSDTGWGDNKGLDLWTYYPTTPQVTSLNIVGNAPDLNIIKSHTGNFIVGKQGAYKLTVANKATAGSITDLTTDPITVTDTLPGGLTFISGAGSNWNCSASGQTVTCNYTGATPIAPGATLPDITITVNVTAAAVAPGGVTNSASVSTPKDTPSSSTGSDNTANDQTNVLLPPVAYKSVKFLRDNNGNNSLNIGDDIQYTLIVENPNTNSVPFTNVVIKDVIPSQLQVLQDASNSISIVTTNNGTNPNFTLDASFPTGNFNGTATPVTFTNPGTLAPGGRVTLIFNARILSGAASPITNQGSVNFDGDQGNPLLTDASDTNNPTAPGSNVNPGNPGTGVGNNISQPNANANDSTLLNFVSDINPTGTKSVRLVVDADNSGTVTTGDTVEYTVTYLNNNPNYTVDDFLVTDSIDSKNLSFIPGSYSFQKFEGIAAVNNTTTVTGNPSYNGTTDPNLTNPTIRGQLGADGGKVVITFRALVKAAAQTTILNQASATSTASQQGVVTKSPSQTDAISGPSDIPQPVGGTNDPTQLPVVASGPPRLRLVKRITNVTRKGTSLSGVNFKGFVSVNADDQAPGWSQLSPVGIVSLPPTSAVQSGDEVEYTIYYLSDGSGSGNNLKFCDLIPAGTTYIPESFGSSNGISFNRSGKVSSLTNNADADEGTFFSPIAPLPTGNTCANQSNPDGAVIVNLGTIPSTPGSNYGFVRFRVNVK